MAKASQAAQPGLENIPGAGTTDAAAEQPKTALAEQAPQGTEENPPSETSNVDGSIEVNPKPFEPPVDSEEPTLLECAVLMDCIYGKHDDIITLPVKEAQAAEQSGCIDTHPNAVAAIRAGV